jgi:protein phosphatase
MADPTVDPEELRYAPRPPRRFLWLRRLALSLVAVGVIAAAAVVAYNWSQQQYYVASYGGRVAIYQGLQADLPGVDLHHVYESQDLMLTELPSFRRSQVLDGLAADDLDHAHLIVDKLVTFARTCVERASSAGATSTSTSPTTEDTPTTKVPSHRPPPSTVPSRRPPSPALRNGATTAPSARSPEKPTPRAPATTAQPSRSPETATSALSTTDATTGATPSEECAGASPATETAR